MMKKGLTTLLFIFCMMSISFAGSSDLFQINDDKISDELSSLTLVEEYVNANQGVTYTDLKNSGNILSKILSPELSTPSGIGYAFESPLGIPSFIWGFCLGIPGIVIVYLVSDEDKDETKKALFGCLAGSLAYTACYVIYFVVYTQL